MPSDSTIRLIMEMNCYSPTTPGLYLFMLCYKNGVFISIVTCLLTTSSLRELGGLAREQIRDSLPPNPPRSPDPWATFNYHATRTRPLGASTESSPAKIALYFPRPEIVPNVQAGTYRYTFDGQQPRLSSPSEWKLPEDDCRAIIESQLLSLRLRSREILAQPTQNPQNVPAQPRRIYLVGGGSQNTAIARLAGEILGGIEGVYRLDVGGNACALGSAYKAVWAVERKPKETFEDLIGKRWREEEFVEKIGDGYEEAQYRTYEKGVSGLEAVEKDVLTRQAIDVGKASTTGAEQV